MSSSDTLVSIGAGASPSGASAAFSAAFAASASFCACTDAIRDSISSGDMISDADRPCTNALRLRKQWEEGCVHARKMTELGI